MASGESLIKLFKSFKENDQVEFTNIAQAIINEERKKNHNLLANKLHNILYDESITLKEVTRKSLNISELPKDKESGFELVDLKVPKRRLDNIIISTSNRNKINDIIMEYQNKELLEGYKLYPKTKILFCGPPGCGKTVTAEAIANELNINLLQTRFDSIISSYLGETSTNLRKVFDFSTRGEWILFFDEFDAIGKSRDDSSDHGELKRVVNNFLQLLDNYSRKNIIIAATNYESMIDRALWRRFDEVIYFGKPNIDEIHKAIELNLRNYHHKKLNLNKFNDRIEDFSYSDIERMCIDCIKKSILFNQNVIDNVLFESVLNSELERKSLLTSDIGGKIKR